MLIQDLHIENLKGIKSLDLKIHQNGAVIYGMNGVGKSTIITAINIIISRILDRTLQGKIKNQVNLNEADVSFGCSTTKIEACLVIEDREHKVMRGYNKKKRTHITDSKPLAEICSQLRDIIEDESETTELPVFVVYGVNRAVIDIPLSIRNKHSFEREYAYERSSKGSDFRVFFEWYRNQEDYENQERANRNSNYRDSQLEAVRIAIHTLLPGFDGLMVERKPKLRMVISKGTLKLAINQLSDGEKCYIAMIGDLARRMAIANPKSKNPLECKGIVLIDEIELHLHPEWQRKVVPSLRRIFPNIQFIITTHSPQVLGEIREMSIINLVVDDNQVKHRLVSSAYGRDSAFILGELMGTEERNIDVIKKITDMYSMINTKDYISAESIVEELCTDVGNDDADVIKARALIARGNTRNEADK